MKPRKPMNHEEAKLILQAYRPGGQDAHDPQFREALEMARRDPELGRWLANEQALDARISERVRTALPPPPFLKSRLLAQRVTARPVAWWRQPLWQLAAAACLALFVTLTVLRPGSDAPTEFAQYRDQMAEFAGKKLDRLDLMSADVEQIRRWLGGKQAHENLVLPSGLNGRPSLGCRLLDWQGHKVSLVCFELGNQQVAHLLVVDSGAFTAPPPEGPTFARVGDVGSMSWSREGKTYVLASKGADDQSLMRLL